jgi:hypothetical protein
MVLGATWLRNEQNIDQRGLLEQKAHTKGRAADGRAEELFHERSISVRPLAHPTGYLLDSTRRGGRRRTERGLHAVSIEGLFDPSFT